jgi:hypothetical protein
MTKLVDQLSRAGAVCLLLVAVGCGDELAPTAAVTPPPAADAMLAESGAAGSLDRIARFQTSRSVGALVGHQWIGPEGGRYELGGFAVEVPAGAVSRSTRFSIRLPADPTGSERVVAVFGPHNTSFAVPVTIEFPLAGTTIAGSESAHVVWWNGSTWIDVGGVATEDGSRLRTTTDHFSTYGTTDEGRSGGTLVSGG